MAAGFRLLEPPADSRIAQMLFSMGIESMLKSLLVQPDAPPPTGHNLVKLAAKGGLILSPREADFLSELFLMTTLGRYPESRNAYVAEGGEIDFDLDLMRILILRLAGRAETRPVLRESAPDPG